MPSSEFEISYEVLQIYKRNTYSFKEEIKNIKRTVIEIKRFEREKCFNKNLSLSILLAFILALKLNHSLCCLSALFIYVVFDNS